MPVHTMLEKISTGRLHSPFILFVDSAECSGYPLFLSIVKSYITSSEHPTHLLCWNRKTARFFKTFQDQHLSKLHLHDCLSNSDKWVNSAVSSSSFLHAILKSLAGENEEVNVVVDSLSDPLFCVGLYNCLQELQQVINFSTKEGPKIRQLLCLVHSDVLPSGPTTLAHLKHFASTCVKVHNQVASITHRKPGGHVEKKEETYTILPEGRFCSRPFVMAGPSEAVYEQPVTLPQNVASFRVSLTEKEKDDRNNLVLPYMRTNDDSSGGGKIFYQPDAVDDWDDEDPDDDLDV